MLSDWRVSKRSGTLHYFPRIFYVGEFRAACGHLSWRLDLTAPHGGEPVCRVCKRDAAKRPDAPKRKSPTRFTPRARPKCRRCGNTVLYARISEAERRAQFRMVARVRLCSGCRLSERSCECARGIHAL